MRIKPYYQDKACTLYNCDMSDLLPQIESNTIALIWTDPPYGFDNEKNDLHAVLNKMRNKKNKPIANDDAENTLRVIGQMFSEAPRILTPGGCCCCCSGSSADETTTIKTLELINSNGLSLFHTIIWDKIRLGLGWQFRRQYERILICKKKKQKINWCTKRKNVSNIMRYLAPKKKLHPNEKPIDMVKNFIDIFTLPGDIVLDPFCGSGTTLRAAKDMGRRAIGVELEKGYCDITICRLKQETLL